MLRAITPGMLRGWSGGAPRGDALGWCSRGAPGAYSGGVTPGGTPGAAPGVLLRGCPEGPP